MRSEIARKTTLFVLLIRESCVQQLAEELEDHIQARAPQVARMIYCGVTERRREGIVWLLVQQHEETTLFTNCLKRMLEHDEDIFAFMEMPLLLLLEQLGEVFTGAGGRAENGEDDMLS